MLESQDLLELETAVKKLESPGLTMQIVEKIGKPIEYALQSLPDKATAQIEKATSLALDKALDVALQTMKAPSGTMASNAGHKAAAVISGGVGGAFGLPALAVELPVSTGIILRSVADIARQEGEDIEQADTRMECLAVFAMGGRSSSDDASETTYYATRAALAAQVKEAAKFVARQGTRAVSRESGPPLVRLIAAVASRFGIVVSEKAAAQLIPAVGAAGGAAINLMFINHFQTMAEGHFTVRKLERKYGKECIQEEYKKVLSNKGKTAGAV
ncbi:MAG: EcsC family protein [Verrucomicrobiales bacterium]|nr:EcsC family protein [Verrucomicrobiales bacterium]